MPLSSATDNQCYLGGNDFCYKIRPIKQNDREKLIDLFNHLSPENRYLRFAHSLSKLPDDYLNDVLELDYQKEMAFVAYTQTQPAQEVIIGIARYINQADTTSCEFSLAVSDAYSAHGVGTNLMHHLIQYAKNHGLTEIFGYVLTNNIKMLTLVRDLDFNIDKTSDHSEFKKVALSLRG
jgi:acetyltransferase